MQNFKISAALENLSFAGTGLGHAAAGTSNLTKLTNGIILIKFLGLRKLKIKDARNWIHRRKSRIGKSIVGLFYVIMSPKVRVVK